jgi:hypothetical protein
VTVQRTARSSSGCRPEDVPVGRAVGVDLVAGPQPVARAHQARARAVAVGLDEQVVEEPRPRVGLGLDAHRQALAAARLQAPGEGGRLVGGEGATLAQRRAGRGRGTRRPDPRGRPVAPERRAVDAGRPQPLGVGLARRRGPELLADGARTAAGEQGGEGGEGEGADRPPGGAGAVAADMQRRHVAPSTPRAAAGSPGPPRCAPLLWGMP